MSRVDSRHDTLSASSSGMTGANRPQRASRPKPAVPEPSVVVVASNPEDVVPFVEHLERRHVAVRVVWDPKYAVHATTGAKATVVLDAALAPHDAAKVRAAAAHPPGGVPMSVLTSHERVPLPDDQGGKSRSPQRLSSGLAWPRLTLQHVWSLVAALVIPTLVVSACGIGAMSQAPAPPALTAVVTPTPKPQAMVQRGTITGQVRAPGRLEPASEVPLTFEVGGQVRSIRVGVGDQVEAGAILAELDAAVNQRQIDDAAFELELRKLRLEQARSRSPSSIEGMLARAAVDRTAAEVRRAQAEMGRIVAGPDPSAIRAAEGELASMEAALRAVQAKLGRLNRPTGPAELGEVQLRVEAARVALDEAKAQFETITGEQALEATEEGLLVAQAQLEFERSKKVHDDLKAGGPVDPERVAILEAQLADALRSLERARLQLQAAEQASDPNQSGAARQLAIFDAQQSLRDSETTVQQRQSQLAVAKAPPTQSEIGHAQLVMEQAQIALRQAEARLKTASDRSDPTLTKEGLALARARLQYDAALREMRAKIEGPDEETRLRVQAEVAAAEAAYREAEGKLSRLRAGPAADRVAEAEAGLHAAQAASAVAQAQYKLKLEEAGNQQLELALNAKILEREVQRDSSRLEELRRLSGATRLIAPVSGTVISIGKKPRDTVDANETVIVLSDLAQMMARASFLEADSAALFPGKLAMISFPGIASVTLPGTITEVSAPILTDTGSIIRAVVRLLEHRDGIRAGQPVDITVDGVVHHNVLIAPVEAVRQSGPRWLATLLGGSDREREVEVRAGLVNDREIEILGGLREGDTLLLPAG